MHKSDRAVKDIFHIEHKESNNLIVYEHLDKVIRDTQTERPWMKDQEIGERARSLRKARKLTLRQVAEAMGKSYSYVGSLERGERTWRQDHIDTLANLYDVPPALLTDPSMPLDRIRVVGRILEELSSLPEEKLEVVLQLLQSMQS